MAIKKLVDQYINVAFNFLLDGCYTVQLVIILFTPHFHAMFFCAIHVVLILFFYVLY